MFSLSHSFDDGFPEDYYVFFYVNMRLCPFGFWLNGVGWSFIVVDAHIFLFTTFCLVSGLNTGWVVFDRDVEPKTLHRACWAARWLTVPPSEVSDLLGQNTHKESHGRQTESVPQIRTNYNEFYFHQDLQR